MPFTAQLSRLLVYGLPLAFVLFTWLASSNFPDLLESDESFVSSLQARSSAIETPRATVSMATRTVDWQRPNGNTSYAHLPSAPRLIHYLLLGAGLRDVSMQILIISLLGTTLTAVLLWRLFGHPALLAMPLAVVLDYTGFLSWTLNPSRIWMFVLFFGLIFTVKRDRPYWFGALAFCLIQLDFRIATFVGATALTFALLVHRLRGFRFIIAGLVGAALPLVIFCLEVLIFYGWEDFVHEMSVGQSWVLTFGTGGDGVRLLYQAGHGPIVLLRTVARDTHNGIVFVMVVAGVVSSLFAVSRGWVGEQHKFLADLTVSAAVGTVVASMTLYSQFVDGFVNATLPLASFLVAPALGSLALELRTLLGLLSRNRHLGTVSIVAILLPLIMASIAHYDPPIEVEMYRKVQSELRQRSSFAPGVDSWFAWSDKLLAQRP